MNRRNFFKTVTGFVAGVCAAFVPKAKAEEWTYVVASYNGKGNSDGIEIYPKRKRIKPAPDDVCKRLPKYHTGDRVHVGDLPDYMSHFRGGNKDATVLYSNTTQDGHGIDSGKKIIYAYALDVDGFGYNAWYPEELLTKICSCCGEDIMPNGICSSFYEKAFNTPNVKWFSLDRTV